MHSKLCDQGLSGLARARIEHATNCPKVNVSKAEIYSTAHFVEQECSLEPETKYPASKLYEAYRHYCQAIGRKPQSTNAFKKALDKITNVYQSRTSSGMQWHGIQPVLQF